MKVILVYFKLLILMFCSNCSKPVPVEWSSVHHKLYTEAANNLLSEGYTPDTYYYDATNNEDGKWKRFKWSKMNDDLLLIQVAKTSQSKENEYNYILVYDSLSNKVIYQSVPFYDAHVDIAYCVTDSKLTLYPTMLFEDEIEKIEKIEINIR